MLAMYSGWGSNLLLSPPGPCMASAARFCATLSCPCHNTQPTQQGSMALQSSLCEENPSKRPASQLLRSPLRQAVRPHLQQRRHQHIEAGADVERLSGGRSRSTQLLLSHTLQPPVAGPATTVPRALLLPFGRGASSALQRPAVLALATNKALSSSGGGSSWIGIRTAGSSSCVPLIAPSPSPSLWPFLPLPLCLSLLPSPLLLPPLLSQRRLPLRPVQRRRHRQGSDHAAPIGPDAQVCDDGARQELDLGPAAGGDEAAQGGGAAGLCATALRCE